MVDHHNPEDTESKPLNTELETFAPEATEPTAPSIDSTSNQPDASTQAPEPEQTEVAGSNSSVNSEHLESLSAGAEEDVDYDSADFAAALASFDREQAAESAAAQNLTQEEAVILGTLVKLT